METTTSDHIPLMNSKKSSTPKIATKICIGSNTFCFCIIIALSSLNLWQAGYLDRNDASKKTIECNNGHKYNDINVCECYQCYTGNRCEQEIDDCIISAGSGQPYLLSEYWSLIAQNNEMPTSNIPVDYRIPYDFTTRGVFYPTSNNSFPQKLSQLIRRVHKKYHNVDIDNKYIIFGVGASQLTTATFVAWSRIRGQQITMFDAIPYYFEFLERCKGATIYHCTFNSSYNLSESEDTIREIITIPNNPNGYERERFYQNQSSYALDLVYYWPQFFNSSDDLQTKNAPVAFFSLTKLSGHAATRFGWAVVDSLELAQEITKWIRESVLQLSIESLRRAWDILSYIETNGDDYFDFIRQRLKERWDVFLDLLEGQNKYLLRSRVGYQYAWIECVNKTDDVEIKELFNSYGIDPFRGGAFGQNGYVRFNLFQFEGNFRRTISRFRQLIAA
eukprot:37311_1